MIVIDAVPNPSVCGKASSTKQTLIILAFVFVDDAVPYLFSEVRRRLHNKLH